MQCLHIDYKKDAHILLVFIVNKPEPFQHKLNYFVELKNLKNMKCPCLENTNSDDYTSWTFHLTIKTNYKQMKVLRFKTNINCNNCKAKVANILNNEKAVKSWNVDIDNPEKILTIEGEVDDQFVKSAVAKAGFRAEAI